MKRATESPGSGGREKAFRRQNPVSCQFCRSKKLKCDRSSPCSNCVARNVECVPATGVNSASFDSAGVADRTRIQPSNQHAIGNESIESRLRRLEEAVFKSHHGNSAFGDPKAAEDDASLSKTADWLESVSGAGPRNGMTGFNVIEDAARGNSIVDLARSRAVPVTSPGSSFPDSGPIPTTTLTYSEILAALPDQPTADVLLNHYIANVSWVYHIIHSPTVKTQLQGIYTSLNACRLPNLSHLAVVATVISIGAYFKSGLAQGPSTREEIKASCKRWAVLAQRALTDAMHHTFPTVETMQANILISQYLPNFAQTDAHASFIGNLIVAAHMLGLHQVDNRRNRKLRELKGCNVIELEVKRRIWWHIVTTDWILCFMSGPQCGTYICHPSQMNVDYPSNCDDIDITADGCINHPMDVPTDMSYSITKILLSTAVRENVDVANSQGLDIDEVEYDDIIQFDQRFQGVVKSLPWYFRMDETSRRQAATIEKERPYIRWQRNMAHFGFNFRLSRLHRPYLIRGLKDPTYAYSRMVCLRAARTVIEMEEQMREVSGGNNPDSGRLWIITHHVFVSTVTLVMDYCCHRDDPQAAERKAEIMKCYQILEKSQEESTVARKGLAQLKQVMREWKMREGVEGPGLDEQDAQALETGEYPSPEGKVESRNLQVQKPQAQAVEGGYPMMDFQGMDMMQDMWIDPFEFNMPENPQWEALFRDLEQPMFG